jgi:hypothetical protein
MWYQNTFTIMSLLIAIIASGALTYGFLTKRKLFTTVSTLVLVMALVIGVSSYNQVTSESEPILAVVNFGSGQSVTLYKTPDCGCCTGHAKALEEAGFVVTIEETNDLDSIKQTHKIPSGGKSCHTTVIGDYVVEGHVPLKAIEKLLIERPQIAGIGLPGMPIGTPGMPGRKTAPYEVYQLSDVGEMSPYVSI